MVKKNSRKKKILIYVASNIHILNAIDIQSKLLNSEIILIYEKNILNSLDNFTKLKKLNQNEYSEFINKNYKYISLIIFSTSQIRETPTNLLYLAILNNIKTLSFQETHQMFLHNSNMNNYLLPTNRILLCSNFEKKIFSNYGYLNEKLLVTGYYYFKEKYNKFINYKITNTRKYITIFLNASSTNSFTSIETLKLQKKLIKKIYQNIHKEYNLLVKIHPVDYKLYDNISYFNDYNNLNIINYDINIYDLINKSEFIFLTGYSQIFIEALILKSKIFLLNIEKNILMKYFKNILNVSDNFKAEIDKKYNNDFKKINNINNINISIHNGRKNIIREIINSNKIPDYNETDKFYLGLLMIYIRSNKCSEKIDSIKFSNLKNKILLNNILSYKITKLAFQKLINKHCKDINIFHILKYLYLQFLIKKRIKLVKNDFNYLYNDEPTYLLNLFFNDRQRLINIFLQNHYYNEAAVLDKKDYYIYNNIVRHKNILFRIFIKVRRFFINYKIRFLNSIFFQLFEIYFKYKVTNYK